MKRTTKAAALILAGFMLAGGTVAEGATRNTSGRYQQVAGAGWMPRNVRWIHCENDAEMMQADPFYMTPELLVMRCPR